MMYCGIQVIRTLVNFKHQLWHLRLKYATQLEII